MPWGEHLEISTSQEEEFREHQKDMSHTRCCFPDSRRQLLCDEAEVQGPGVKRKLAGVHSEPGARVANGWR